MLWQYEQCLDPITGTVKALEPRLLLYLYQYNTTQVSWPSGYPIVFIVFRVYKLERYP